MRKFAQIKPGAAEAAVSMLAAKAAHATRAAHSTEGVSRTVEAVLFVLLKALAHSGVFW
jgi:hypothetical protein